MTDEPAPAAARPALAWQSARLTRVEPQTARVKSFFVAPSQPFEFRAGQHVDVRLTAPDGYQAERSYSIASAPEAGTPLELVIELLDDGEVSPYFHEIAEVGDEIEIRGPIGGHFIWSANEGGPLLLVGGGSGVVPLMAMIRHYARRLTAEPAGLEVLLLLAARTVDDVIFHRELLELEQAHAGFSLLLALSRGRAEREHDYSRRIDREMLSDVLARLPAAPKQVFVCGANPFVEAATQGLVSAGVAPSSVRTERYGG